MVLFCFFFSFLFLFVLFSLVFSFMDCGVPTSMHWLPLCPTYFNVLAFKPDREYFVLVSGAFPAGSTDSFAAVFSVWFNALSSG